MMLTVGLLLVFDSLDHDDDDGDDHDSDGNGNGEDCGHDNTVDHQ